MVKEEISMGVISEVMSTIKKQNEVKKLCSFIDEECKEELSNFSKNVDDSSLYEYIKGYIGYMSLFLTKMYISIMRISKENKWNIKFEFGEDDTVLTDEKEPVGIIRFSDNTDGFVLHLDTYSMYKGNPRYYVKK